MSSLACPCCGEATYPFGRGGGAALAAQLGVPLLGEVPLEPALREGSDSGEPVFVSHPDDRRRRAPSRRSPSASRPPAPRPRAGADRLAARGAQGLSQRPRTLGRGSRGCCQNSGSSRPRRHTRCRSPRSRRRTRAPAAEAASATTSGARDPVASIQRRHARRSADRCPWSRRCRPPPCAPAPARCRCGTSEKTSGSSWGSSFENSRAIPGATRQALPGGTIVPSTPVASVTGRANVSCRALPA